MLHNLFHSLPCIHTLSGSKSLHSADMTSTTTYVEPPFFEYCLSDMSLNKYTLLSFFLYDTWFFLISSLQCLHTFLVTKVHLVGVPFLVPISISSCQSICYRLSISFFCTPYIFAYQPIIDIYGFANFSFFWYTKIPYAHCIFFLKPSHLWILFLRLTSYIPFFWHRASLFLLVSSASSASFSLTEQHTPCFPLLFMFVD